MIVYYEFKIQNKRIIAITIFKFEEDIDDVNFLKLAIFRQTYINLKYMVCPIINSTK